MEYQTVCLLLGLSHVVSSGQETLLILGILLNKALPQFRVHVGQNLHLFVKMAAAVTFNMLCTNNIH